MAIDSSRAAILYQQSAGKRPGEPLEGLFLPALRRFYIPSPIGAPVALSSTTLYTETDQGTLRAATITPPSR